VDHEEYVERVLVVVEQVPAGRVTTYGAIADAVGTGGPRQVGRVMATWGSGVPWWRVVRADGSLPEAQAREARHHYLDEGTPVRGSGRVDVAAAFWGPESPGRTVGDV
jgi:alkylated DNA nucleotide flippase Atl1